MRGKGLPVLAVLTVMAAACGGGEAKETTAATAATTTTVTRTTIPETTTSVPIVSTTIEAPTHPETPLRSLPAPAATVTVDGDPSDWSEVTGLEVVLEPIVTMAPEGIDDVLVTLKVTHDAENLYLLVAVDDDYNWDAGEAHLSGSVAVMFPVDTGGPHMGADDEEGEPSVGMVDIWHWELECAAGVESGGAVNPPGEGKDAGNDSACNFDDEWATDADTREDDNSATGENSLLGVWTHSSPTEDAAGTWYFEMSRPLQTDDEQDAQFSVGESVLVALAYWDPDFGPEGWQEDTHVQSSNQGWIELRLG